MQQAKLKGLSFRATRAELSKLLGIVQQAKLKGLSFRATARELGIHRNTVRKYALAESPPLRRIKSAATTLQPETGTPA